MDNVIPIYVNCSLVCWFGMLPLHLLWFLRWFVCLHLCCCCCCCLLLLLLLLHLLKLLLLLLLQLLIVLLQLIYNVHLQRNHTTAAPTR